VGEFYRDPCVLRRASRYLRAPERCKIRRSRGARASPSTTSTKCGGKPLRRQAALLSGQTQTQPIDVTFAIHSGVRRSWSAGTHFQQTRWNDHPTARKSTKSTGCCCPMSTTREFDKRVAEPGHRRPRIAYFNDSSISWSGWDHRGDKATLQNHSRSPQKYSAAFKSSVESGFTPHHSTTGRPAALVPILALSINNNQGTPTSSSHAPAPRPLPVQGSAEMWWRGCLNSLDVNSAGPIISATGNNARLLLSDQEGSSRTIPRHDLAHQVGTKPWDNPNPNPNPNPRHPRHDSCLPS
jgi:hypothetical protein